MATATACITGAMRPAVAAAPARKQQASLGSSFLKGSGKQFAVYEAHASRAAPSSGKRSVTCMAAKGADPRPACAPGGRLTAAHWSCGRALALHAGRTRRQARLAGRLTPTTAGPACPRSDRLHQASAAGRQGQPLSARRPRPGCQGAPRQAGSCAGARQCCQPRLLQCVCDGCVVSLTIAYISLSDLPVCDLRSRLWLASQGVNIMQFCKEYNAATQDKIGTIIPVEIAVYEVRCAPHAAVRRAGDILARQPAAAL